MGFSVGDIVQSNDQQTGLIIETKWGYQGWDWITVFWYSPKSPYTYIYPVDKTIRTTFKVIT